MSVCIRGLSAGDTNWGRALKRCLADSLDREAVEELRAQCISLGKDMGSTLSGLLGAIDRFQSPIVNAYAPDVVFEDVLQKNLLVYATPQSIRSPETRKPVPSRIQAQIRWWSMPGSNRRPPQCHCGALPAELMPRFPTRRAGLGAHGGAAI